MGNFGTLRFIATLNRIVAWVALVLGIVAALGVVIIAIIGGSVDTPLTGSLTSGMGPVIGAIVVALVLAGMTLIVFVALNACADAIHLAIAIEENTRKMTELLTGEAALNASSTAPWESR
jgi:hypothetical protein